MDVEKKKPILGGAVHLISAGGLAEGFKALIRFRADGVLKVFDIWTAEEIQRNPAKSDVKLYYFPALAGKSPLEENSPQTEDPSPEIKPFALVCPGGAYAMVGLIPEGFPTAAALNDLGFTAFVLVYRTGKNAHYPAPMDDLAQAVNYIRNNADQLGVATKGYSIWGFSAGGHLATSFGTDNMGAPKYDLPMPATIVAAYPLITMGESTHEISRILLLGRHFSQQDIDMSSVEKHITGDYPPTYVWACINDPVVDSVNSDMLAQALENNGVSHQLLKVDADLHGCGLGRGTPVDGWFEAAMDFWRQQLDKPSL